MKKTTLRIANQAKQKANEALEAGASLREAYLIGIAVIDDHNKKQAIERLEPKQ